MIEGFRIDVTAAELVAHLEGRVRAYRGRADACEDKIRRLEAGQPMDDETEDQVAIWPGFGPMLERRLANDRNREELLSFLRDHVVAQEVYRLSEADLRSLEIWPDEESETES